MNKIALKTPKRVRDLFEPTRNKLFCSGLNLNYETYVGYILFISFILGLSMMTIIYALFKINNFGTIPSLSYSIIFGIFTIIITVGISYSIPYLLSDNRGRIIDATIPSIANYMSILATTGMTTGNIITSLGRVSEEYYIKSEMDLIITDIEVLGYDLYNALRHAYDLSSSRNFANLLFGVVSVSQMGGDLASYLRNQAEKNTNKRLLLMRGFIDTLAIIAEIYITIMVVGPLMLIVMLTVMSFIGGAALFGGLSVSFAMRFLTYLFIPIGIIMLILTVEATSPVK
jgi:flagellar protein FlaJ